MAIPAGDRLGVYQILAPIGEGGMGEVYRALDTKLHRQVALKVLPDHLATDIVARQRFQHEAEILATLNHANVAAIYGFEDSTDRIALVMELVEGTPLSFRIGTRGLPVTQALKLAAQVAAGLEATHHVGVVHRDLKPANVLVTASGTVKLVDFGIAKVVLQGAGASVAETRMSDAPPRTEEGQILGTVAYMSPEQVRGEPIDARSDLFSFGTLLYELLTGRRPFDAGDRVSTLAAILHREPEPLGLPQIPRELERIVLRCLRKDRERRFQTASDLKLALEDLEEDTARTPVPSAIASTARLGREAWARWSLVGFVLVAAAAAGAFALWKTPRERSAPALRQLTFDAGVAITPALSPDGKLLAYASDRSGEGQLDIWLKQVVGGEPVRLTSGADSKVNPQFSSNGTRLYFLGGRDAIYEVPALGGSSRRVIEAAGPFSVSTRGDIAFHRPGTGTAPGPMFVLSAGAASAQPWHPECVSLGAPVWSPDGTRIAFAGVCGRDAEGGQRIGEILVGAVGGGAIERVGTIVLRSAAPRIAWARLASGRELLMVPERVGDAINLHHLGFDGHFARVTQGTGYENWPVVSASGEVMFTRADVTPSIWSLALSATGEAPRKEASPGRMFGTSADGSKLVFGRMLGTERGELVLRDRARNVDTVLASHTVRLEGSGSFWPQVSPDGRRVVYRVLTNATIAHYALSTDGGAPRQIETSSAFNNASDWSSDGRRLIGECLPFERGICELLPDSGAVRPILHDPGGGQLLYPSFAWDGRWVAFMHRRSGQTRVQLTPVAADGSLAGEEKWIVVSPDDADGARPRLSPDGNSLFYQLTRGNVVTLVRQALQPVSRQPIGQPVRLAAIQNIPQSVFNIGLQTVVTVTRDRVFFNNAEVRSSVWMTRIE